MDYEDGRKQHAHQRPVAGRQTLTEPRKQQTSEPGKSTLVEQEHGGHDDLRAAIRTVAGAFGLSAGGLRVQLDAQRAATGGGGIVDGDTAYLDPRAADPSTSRGRNLIAHELVHLAQKRLPGTGDQAAAELEADQLAAMFASGTIPSAPRVPLAAGATARRDDVDQLTVERLERIVYSDVSRKLARYQQDPGGTPDKKARCWKALDAGGIDLELWLEAKERLDLVKVKEDAGGTNAKGLDIERKREHSDNVLLARAVAIRERADRTFEMADRRIDEINSEIVRPGLQGQRSTLEHDVAAARSVHETTTTALTRFNAQPHLEGDNASVERQYRRDQAALELQHKRTAGALEFLEGKLATVRGLAGDGHGSPLTAERRSQLLRELQVAQEDRAAADEVRKVAKQVEDEARKWKDPNAKEPLIGPREESSVRKAINEKAEAILKSTEGKLFDVQKKLFEKKGQEVFTEHGKVVGLYASGTLGAQGTINKDGVHVTGSAELKAGLVEVEESYTLVDYAWKLLGEDVVYKVAILVKGSIGAEAKGQLALNVGKQPVKLQGDEVPKVDLPKLLAGTGLEADDKGQAKPSLASVTGGVEAFAGAKASIGVAASVDWKKKAAVDYQDKLKLAAQVVLDQANLTMPGLGWLLRNLGTDTMVAKLLGVLFEMGKPGQVSLLGITAEVEGSAGIGYKGQFAAGIEGTSLKFTASGAGTLGVGVGGTVKISLDLVDGPKFALIVLGEFREHIRAWIDNKLVEAKESLADFVADLGMVMQWVEADDKVREAVAQRAHEHAPPAIRAKMIATLAGADRRGIVGEALNQVIDTCGDEDTAAITTILEFSQAKGDLARVMAGVPHVTVAALMKGQQAGDAKGLMTDIGDVDKAPLAERASVVRRIVDVWPPDGATKLDKIFTASLAKGEGGALLEQLGQDGLLTLVQRVRASHGLEKHIAAICLREDWRFECVVVQPCNAWKIGRCESGFIALYGADEASKQQAKAESAKLGAKNWPWWDQRYHCWATWIAPPAALPAAIDMTPHPLGHKASFNNLGEALKHAIGDVTLAKPRKLAADIGGGTVATNMMPTTSLKAMTGVSSGITGRAKPGQQITVQVSAKNISAFPWPQHGDETGKYRFRIGNHWLDAAGAKVVRWDDGRAGLPHDLLAGGQVETSLVVTAPTEPGTYRLQIDMTQEGVGWSSTYYPSQLSKVTVIVA